MSKTNEDIARALQSRRIVQTLMYDEGVRNYCVIVAEKLVT